MPDSPSLVAWSDHALVKAALLGLARSEIEDRVLVHHQERQRNDGAGDWLLAIGRVVVIYNYPDDEDWTTARIVTLWRQR